MGKEQIKDFIKFKMGVLDGIAGLFPGPVAESIHQFKRDLLAAVEEVLKETPNKQSGVRGVPID